MDLQKVMFFLLYILLANLFMEIVNSTDILEA